MREQITHKPPETLTLYQGLKKKIILKVSNLQENIQNISGYPVPRVGLSQICAKAGEARSNLR